MEPPTFLNYVKILQKGNHNIDDVMLPVIMETVKERNNRSGLKLTLFLSRLMLDKATIR